MTTKTRRYWVAINSYRSSTDSGFCNTWKIAECEDRATQIKLLTEGLPVQDVCGLANDGTRYPVSSNRGIRLATRDEIRAAKRDQHSGYGDITRWCIDDAGELAQF